MILANVLSGVIRPIATIFGWLLAAFYSFSHSYGISIILLTLVTMIVVFPLTRKGTRSMMQMQLLQPELLKLRGKSKVLPGMTTQEKQEVRQKQQTEMMALYKENGVSPTGGCLPMFLQFPIFIVLYDTIRGMTKTELTGKAHQTLVSTPQYINEKTALYTSLKHSAGRLNSFGLNLADSVRTHQHSWVDVVPYVAVILVAVALQYVSIWQITNRNPAASQANPQMQAAQKFMPLIFIIFYIVLPAGVGVYFIVSSAFRVAQQEYMYKHDPSIVAAVQQLSQRKASEPPVPKKSMREMLRDAAGDGASRKSLQSGAPAEKRSPQSGSSKPGSSKPGSSKPGGKSGTRPSTTAANGRLPAKNGGQSRNGQQSRGSQPGGKPRPGGTTSGQPNRGGKASAAGKRPQTTDPRPAPGGVRKSSSPTGPSTKPSNGNRAADGGSSSGSTGSTSAEAGSSSGAGAQSQPAKDAGTGAPPSGRPRRPQGRQGASPNASGANTTDGRNGTGKARPDSNGSGNQADSNPSGEPRRPRRPA